MILTILAGINLGIAFIGIWISRLNKREPLYLSFTVLSLFSGLYLLSSQLEGSYDNWSFQVTIFFAAIYYLTFCWFNYFVDGTGKLRTLSLVTSAVYITTFVYFLLQPENPVWLDLSHTGLLLLVILLVLTTRNLNRNRRAIRREYGVLTILFILLSLDEILYLQFRIEFYSHSDLGFIPLDTYPILFTIAVAKRLSSDLNERSRLKIRALEGDLAKEKSKRLEAELNSKQKDLNGIQSLIAKQDLFLEHIKALLAPVSKDDDPKIKSVLSEINSYRSNNSALGLVNSNIDLLNSAFVERLKSQYPTLTKKDLELCLLLRLNLSSKEIASVKSVSPDSVKVMRSRLRKKLNLGSKDNLSEVLASF